MEGYQSQCIGLAKDQSTQTREEVIKWFYTSYITTIANDATDESEKKVIELEKKSMIFTLFQILHAA